jgi:hypothetical protein
MESVASRIKQDGGPNVSGYIHRMEADTVRKILRKHGTDPLPVTKEDFEKLPEIVSSVYSQSLPTTGFGCLVAG